MSSIAAKTPSPIHDLSVQIPAGKDMLEGVLNIPQDAEGIIIFAHGSGSGRHSPRNRYVAKVLGEHALATVLADLLTTQEEAVDRQTRHLRFDISLLARRLENIVLWAEKNPETKSLPIGLFGASTGAAAALIVAAKKPEIVRSVVSRGGRPDLAGDFLPMVKAPTLLIVGQNDPEVITLNKQALENLNALSTLDIIPHATHLFEEPGALEKAAQLAAGWFKEHIG